ncbi:glutaminase [Atractiella rhizophila]|nr:glutaminase [Atractiella rhizophila]
MKGWLSSVIPTITSLLAVASAQTFTPITPHSFPLAVRTPYVSAWLPGSQAASFPSTNPQFWRGQDLTWSVIARVDGVAYNLFGVPAAEENTKAATVVGGSYTSTRTIFNVQAGGATFELLFFSPVAAKDLLRGSLPFSYLTVTATPAAGSSSSVQIYSDIDASWTGQTTSTVNAFSTVDATAIYQLELTNPALWTQNNEMALWGTTVYSTRPSASSKLTSQSGPLSIVRSAFVASGALSGEQPAWAEGSVNGFAHDLGTISAASAVTFAVGHHRVEAVNFFESQRTGFYRATYPDASSAVVHFLDDYASALEEGIALDAAVEQHAGKISQNYVDITSLAVRQTFGALDVTIPLATLDTSDPLVFMKEISSDGNVNTADVIYPALPLFYVINAEYIRYLLEPVARYLNSGRWPKPYAVHDIGANYPNATGHDDGNAEFMPLESTGDLFIGVYTYTHATGNTSWAESYSNLFKGYADYLVANSLSQAEQLSTDDFAGVLTNQTGLTIKSAVALAGYGALTNQPTYSDYATQLVDILYNQGLGTDEAKTHFTVVYNNGTNMAASWATHFNLFPQVLNGLNLFPQASLDMMSAWYPQHRSAHGVQLTSLITLGKTDWMIWAAATSSATTRDMFIDDVHDYATFDLAFNNEPFSDRYVVDTGHYSDFRARPVQGGLFAVMALEGANIL